MAKYLTNHLAIRSYCLIIVNSDLKNKLHLAKSVKYKSEQISIIQRKKVASGQWLWLSW